MDYCNLKSQLGTDDLPRSAWGLQREFDGLDLVFGFDIPTIVAPTEAILALVAHNHIRYTPF